MIGMLLILSACGSVSSEDEETSAQTDSNDISFSVDAYKEKSADNKMSIEQYAGQYEQEIKDVLEQGEGSLDFSKCEFADFPDTDVLKVMVQEKHGITVQEAETIISDWLESIGKQDVVNMKTDVYYIPDSINETGEPWLFYEYKAELEDGEGTFVDNPECYIQLLQDGIYSASDGKIREYMGYEDSAMYDAFGDHAENVVECGKVSALAEKKYQLMSGEMSIEEGAELVKEYFSQGTPYPCEKGVTVDVPEVSVFRLGDIYGYNYTLRRIYENVPFAYMDTGHYRFYADYLAHADIKHAYVVDDTGVTAFCGYNEAKKLIELFSDDQMLGFKQSIEILKGGLASRLNISAERAGLVYFPVQFQSSEDPEETIIFPCWEIYGTNNIKDEKIHIYVDVFTGEIYYYTTESR